MSRISRVISARARSRAVRGTSVGHGPFCRIARAVARNKSTALDERRSRAVNVSTAHKPEHQSTKEYAMSNLPVTPLEGTHLVVGAGEVGTATAVLLAEVGRPSSSSAEAAAGPERCAHPTGRRRRGQRRRPARGRAATPSSSTTASTPSTRSGRPTGRPWRRPSSTTPSAPERCSRRCRTSTRTVRSTCPMTEDLPLAATGTKAKVRARCGETPRPLNDAGRIRATEVRGSDYICPGAAEPVRRSRDAARPCRQGRAAARRRRPTAQLDGARRRGAHPDHRRQR